jgi:hypothetical protein
MEPLRQGWGPEDRIAGRLVAPVAVRRAGGGNKEATTDLLRGRRREMDLVAQVTRRDGTRTLVIVRVELQSRPVAAFPWRLFEYYPLLRRLIMYRREGRNEWGS